MNDASELYLDDLTAPYPMTLNGTQQQTAIRDPMEINAPPENYEFSFTLFIAQK